MSWPLKRTILALVGLATLTVTVLATLATVTKLPGEEKTPAGTRRDTALYLTMRDGVQIAVDVWLPQDYQTGNGCRSFSEPRATGVTASLAGPTDSRWR